MDKNDLFERIDSLEDRLLDVAQELWDHPELGLQEENSAELLASFLEEEGFNVETDIGGMPTAFVASCGDGGPTIGILGEYDALPGLSQTVSATREPVDEGGPGHGCGHNLFGVAGVGAAIGIKDAIDAGDLEGTIVFYGCPAEETLVGKTYMARAGVFDELDAALTWHPGRLSTPTMSSFNALNSLTFTYEGTSAHAAASPDSGRSALDGVELLNLGVEFMREHVSDDARIHYSITDGGGAPNVVPGTATVWYFVRAPSRAEVERNTAWLRDIADAAATMTQTDVSERFLTGCYDYQPNEIVTNVIWDNMKSIDPIEYDESDREFASELQETIPDEDIDASLSDLPDELFERVRASALYVEPVPAYDQDETIHGSTDVGDVSWITPTGQFRAATWPIGTPSHSWQIVAANGDFSQKGISFAAKVLAGSAFDLLDDSRLLEAVRTEFEATIGTDQYESPLPDDAKPPFDITSMGGN